MHKLSNSVERKFIDSIDLTEWEIDTDSGWQDISAIHKTIPYQKYTLVTESGKELISADTHILFDENYNEVFTKDCIPNQTKIITRDGPELVISLEISTDYDNMYDFTVDSEDHRFYANDILSHNSITVASMLLWYALFNEDFSIAILAHKAEQSRVILDRIQKSYEALPAWLQQGIAFWNKGSLELENGSKIKAAATSAGSIRGDSFNLIYLDEFAFVDGNLQASFFAAVYPTISSGDSTKVLITSTPNGLDLFYKIWSDSENGKNSYVRVEIDWWDVPGRDEEWKKKTIANTSEEQFRQEFQCHFLSSTNTLIDGATLSRLTIQNPIPDIGGDYVNIYETPRADLMYFCMVDTSHGLGGDYSAIVIVEASKIPYRVVACYRHNKISALLLPNTIYSMCKYYNDALALIETNDVGMQVANILKMDMEYENCFMSKPMGRAGQTIATTHSNQSTPGVRTTKQVKRIGCANLKTLIESDRLIVNDFNLIHELSTFVSDGSSYEATPGHHDDLVMCLVLFAWLTNQDLFKQLTDIDIRRNLHDANVAMLEEELTPFGIIDDGQLSGFDFWPKDELDPIFPLDLEYNRF